MKRICPIVCILICTVYSQAQTIAIKAGHLVDPKSGITLSNQIILVKDGIINEIGTDVDTRAAEKIIDLSSAWVLPGLMDCHVHITYNDAYRKYSQAGSYLVESNGFRALRGAYNAELLLKSGFTTIKDIGNDGNYATADVIRASRQGWIKAPTIYYSGKIIAPYGGQTSGISLENEGFWKYEYIDADTHDEIVKAVRQNIYFGANVIKMVSGDQRYVYSEEDIRTAVNEAHNAGVKLTCHVMGGKAALNVIMGGADAIEHGFDLSDSLLQLMKDKGTYLVGTDLAFENIYAYGGDSLSAKKVTEGIIDRLKRAYRIGTKMAFGTDVIIDLPGKNRVQSNMEVLKNWKAAQIPAMYILRTMTFNAAELLGTENTRGIIAPGFRADIISMTKNPLVDIENINTVNFVMKNGKVIRHDEAD